MGWSPKDGDPIKLNGAFFTLCTILRFVVASAAEAELGALFLHCEEGIIFRRTLEELGHPQPRTPVHCDNVLRRVIWVQYAYCDAIWILFF
jgi:hypothetical protein